MTPLKMLAAAAVFSTLAAPAMAQDVYHRDHAHHRGPVGAAADTAAGIAGAADCGSYCDCTVPKLLQLR